MDVRVALVGAVLFVLGVAFAVLVDATIGIVFASIGMLAVLLWSLSRG